MSAFSLDHVRLGAFLAIGIALFVAVVLFFSVRDRTREAFLVVTYFDEHVTGLEYDAPVRYRGVEVGRVRNITIAPDKVRVEVLLALTIDDLKRLGLDPAAMRQRMRDERNHLGGEGLRAMLQGNLVTGKLFVQLDFLPDAPAPFVPDGFVPEHPHLPSAPSSLKTFETQITTLLNRMPVALDKVERVLARLEAKIADADVKGLAEKVKALVAHADEQVQRLDLPALVAAVTGGVEKVTGRTDDVGRRLDALLAEEGPLVELIASLRGASDELKKLASSESIPATVDGVAGAAADFRATLKAARLLLSEWSDAGEGLRETLRQIRALSTDLTAEPESLLFGPRTLRKED